MKKQELIEELNKEIEKVKINTNWREYLKHYEKGKKSGLRYGLLLVEKLDEPELPVIPYFVADWIEFAKDVGIKLAGVMDFDTITVYKDYPKIEFQKLKEYMVNGNNQKTVARAWLDDYTIEPEKKYILKNQRGYVSSMIVQQSQAKLKSHIRINYTENEKEARWFNKYDKDFFTEVGHLEVEEVNDK